jgi:hypothetical protein
MCEQSQQLRNEIASLRNDVTSLRQRNETLRQMLDEEHTRLLRSESALQPIKNLVVFTQDAP